MALPIIYEIKSATSINSHPSITPINAPMRKSPSPTHFPRDTKLCSPKNATPIPRPIKASMKCGVSGVAIVAISPIKIAGIKISSETFK